MTELFAPAALTVSELNALARELLESRFAGLWVAGEVSNLTRAASGHYYFSLKDGAAQVRCVMFKFAAQRLAVPLQEGAHIEVAGKISLYEARGEFQITVSQVRQVGLGQLYERYERLKQALQAEGLFDAARKRPLPARPRCIGIVTSLAAAALRDVVSTLRRRAPEIPLVVYPAAVQGAGSERTLAAAIQAAAEHNQADVLIVCRGGGSIEDLWAFNEEVLVRAVAASPIPLVSGVGHETDFTLCDFAADLRAPTPTAAAELAAPDRAETLRLLANRSRLLTELLRRHYQHAAQRTDAAAARLQHPRRKLQEQRDSLSAQARQLQQAFRLHLAQRRQQSAAAARLLQLQKPDGTRHRRELTAAQTAFARAGGQFFRQAAERLQRQQTLLHAVSPDNILARGFAVVRTARGKVVRDTASLKTGQKLQLMLADGSRGIQVLPPHGQGELFD